MKNYGTIFEDFFDYPDHVKNILIAEEPKDEKYSDGVVYPNIVRLPKVIQDLVDEGMAKVIGPAYSPVLSFARYSFAGVTPPHWAHSDFNIAQMAAFIYMNHGHEDAGTATLRHKLIGMTSHPKNEMEKSQLLRDANRKDLWDIEMNFKSKYNRLVIIDGSLIHAAMGEYGSTKEDGRLVITVFFNLVMPA